MFAQQMAILEQKQAEELKQKTSRTPSVRGGSVSRTVSPPPGSEQLKAQFGNFDDPEEGLHGSNVPGLRSVPHSRRQSGGEEGRPAMAGAAKRGTRTGDLVGAFERMNVGANGSATPPRNPRAPFESSTNPGSRSDSPRPGQAQHSAVQRVMTGAGNSPNKDGANTTEGNNFTPTFNENFLFDDELDAESAFVKKYNLQEGDDNFPVLIRRDSFPGESKNSEWPQFAPNRQTGGKSDNGDAAERRGRSEKSSPRLGGSQQLPAPNGTGRSSPPSTAAHRTAPGTPATGGGGAATSSSTSSLITKNGATGATDDASKAFLNSGDASSAGFGTFGINSFTAGSKSSSATRFGPYSPSAAFDSSANGNGDIARTRPSSGYFEAFSSNTNSPSGLLGGTSKYGSAIGQETNKLPPASTAAAAAAAAAAAGLKQTRKGELDINTKLEDLQGDIFTLCKDQHGCRYLQKKLEEGVPAHRDMIFAETFPHFAELMTDPFGNYLCQKMLEYCTDDQRNLIVESVAGELVGISLNMHGTRAVQKTIDFLSTPRQIHSIIVALSMNVVTLIKDLNGNHVIQKCLNRLGAEDNQFIYNAVAAHCVEVATHRHGCCVLQRCIDHASDSQRMQLVAEITYNALTLVQDPFGNYVVQYVLDLNDARFSDAVIRQFVGNVCALSVQKFSSNVIEKCIRVSEASTRKALIEELLNRTRLEKLLRDAFANYVVQTALDYADPAQRAALVDCIRPILPMIRNTPYGKRIQSKLHRDNYEMHGHGHGGHHHHHHQHPGHGNHGPNMPYPMMQAAHHQQMQAMAAMANRQMAPGEFSSMPPFAGPMAGMPPHMYGPGHARPPMGPPGQFHPMGSPYGPPQGSPMMAHGSNEFSPAPVGVQGGPGGFAPGRYNGTY